MKRLRPAKLAFGSGITGIYLFLLLPIVVVFLASISETSYLTFPPRQVTLKWYAKVFSEEKYLFSFRYSLLVAGCTVLFSSIIGTLAAYGTMQSDFRGKNLINSFIMSPLIFPMLIIGIALLQFYSLLKVSGTFWGLVLGHIVITFPYVVRTVAASLYRFDQSLEEAAMTLGANRFKSFFLIVLPAIRPGIIAGAIFTFIVSFDNVPVSIFLLGVKHATLPVVIFSSIEYGVDPSIAAISTILICLTAAIIYITEKWIGFSRFV
jgi:putative spermidine/putrescine transport system permease protein